VTEQNRKQRSSHLDTVKKVARVLGIVIAASFCIWLIVGVIPVVPSIIDVFGMGGLRVPTGIVIGGLMLAAFGFADF
jgi:hypothetical protein